MLAGSLASCKTPDSASDVKILNGIEASAAEFPEVAQVQDDVTKRPKCSGTWLGPNVLLTAAHCLDGPELLSVRVRDVRPRFVLAKKNGDEKTKEDLAVLIFDGPMTSAFAMIAEEAPRPGDEFTIVGFGCTVPDTSEGMGVKRHGKGHVMAVRRDGTIIAKALPAMEAGESGSDTCFGDSGGPLFVNGKLAGATSRGTDEESEYVGLRGKWARFLIRQAVGFGAEIPGVKAPKTLDASQLSIWDSRHFETALADFEARTLTAQAAFQRKIQALIAAGGQPSDLILFAGRREESSLKTVPHWLGAQYVTSPVCQKLLEGTPGFSCRESSVFGIKEGETLESLPEKLQAAKINAAIWTSLTAVGEPPDEFALSGELEIKLHVVYRDGTHQIF